MAVHRLSRPVVGVVLASSRGSCATSRNFRPVPLQRRTQSSWLPDRSESAGGDRALLSQHLKRLADVSGFTAALPCREVSEVTCFSSALGLTDPCPEPGARSRLSPVKEAHPVGEQEVQEVPRATHCGNPHRTGSAGSPGRALNTSPGAHCAMGP